MKDLVIVGGAGYIGSALAHYCVGSTEIRSRYGRVCVVDSMVRHMGFRLSVPDECYTYEVSSHDMDSIHKALGGAPIDVVYLADRSVVSESVGSPLSYFAGLSGLWNFLDYMNSRGPCRLIYASTCAVYGNASGYFAVGEDHRPDPVSPYGSYKLASEMMLESCSSMAGVRTTALRLFNVAGAVKDSNGRMLGSKGIARNRIVPLAVTAAMTGSAMRINGNQYRTVDGTCVRSYVDICSVLRAIVDELIMRVGCPFSLYNVGSEVGSSVLDVIKEVERQTGVGIKTEISSGLRGDADYVVPASSRYVSATSLLGLCVSSEIDWYRSTAPGAGPYD